MWVDLCESSLCERYFAVVAESVFIDLEVISGPAVLLDSVLFGEAEAPAYIIVPDDGPAGEAGIWVEGGGVF